MPSRSTVSAVVLRSGVARASQKTLLPNPGGIEGVFAARRSLPVDLRDTGLLHLLAGLRLPKDLDTWTRRGASFEGLAIEELISRAVADRPPVPGGRPLPVAKIGSLD